MRDEAGPRLGRMRRWVVNPETRLKAARGMASWYAWIYGKRAARRFLGSQAEVLGVEQPPAGSSGVRRVLGAWATGVLMGGLLGVAVGATGADLVAEARARAMPVGVVASEQEREVAGDELGRRGAAERGRGETSVRGGVLAERAGGAGEVREGAEVGGGASLP